MAIRAPRNSASKASAHRLFVPTMLVLVFVTAAALVLYNGSEPVLHPVSNSCWVSFAVLGFPFLVLYPPRSRSAMACSDPVWFEVDFASMQYKGEKSVGFYWSGHAKFFFGRKQWHHTLKCCLCFSFTRDVLMCLRRERFWCIGVFIV